MSKKVEFLIVGLVIISGIFLRIWGLADYHLGLDEVIHSNFSNFRLGHHIARYYSEVHPPLAYLIIGIFQEINPTPIMMRMVSIIPGITILIIIYPFFKSFFQSKFSAFLALTIFAYGNDFIYLSQDTRSYILATLFFLLTIFYLFKLVRTTCKSDLIKFYVCGTFCLFSDYSTISLMLVANLFIYLLLFLKKLDSNNFKLITLCSLTQFNIILIQKLLVNQFSSFRITNINYLTIQNFNAFEQVLKTIHAIFSTNYFESPLLSALVFYCVIGSFIILVLKKKYLIPALLTVLLTVSIIFSQLNLFPLLPDRHSILISFSGLFLIGAAGFELENSSINFRYLFRILTIVIFLTISTQTFINTDNLSFKKIQPQKVGYEAELEPHKSELQEIIDNFLKPRIKKDDILFTGVIAVPEIMKKQEDLIANKILNLFGKQAVLYHMKTSQLQRLIYTNNTPKYDYLYSNKVNYKKPVRNKFWCLHCHKQNNFLDEITIIDELALNNYNGNTFSFIFKNNLKR